MWDRLTILRDRHIGTEIVVELLPSSLRDDNALISIAGNFWNSRWVVRDAWPAGALPPANFFPSLAIVTRNSSIVKSKTGRLCNNDQVMDLVAKAERNPLLAKSSLKQIAAFKKTAHACGWRKRPENPDFGHPYVPQANPETTTLSPRDVYPFM